MLIECYSELIILAGVEILNTVIMLYNVKFNWHYVGPVWLMNWMPKWTVTPKVGLLFKFIKETREMFK